MLYSGPVFPRVFSVGEEVSVFYFIRIKTLCLLKKSMSLCDEAARTRFLDVYFYGVYSSERVFRNATMSDSSSVVKLRLPNSTLLTFWDTSGAGQSAPGASLVL